MTRDVAVTPDTNPTALAWSGKDPDDVLDFTLDWTGRLEGVDFIAASSWAVNGGDGALIIDSQSFTTTAAALWLSGGTDGQRYELVSSITTDQNREMEQTVRLKVKAH